MTKYDKHLSVKKQDEDKRMLKEAKIAKGIKTKKELKS